MFYPHLGYFSGCDRLEGLECESLTVETKLPASPIESEYIILHKDSTTRRYGRYLHILVFMFSLCTAFILFFRDTYFQLAPTLNF